MAKPASRPGQGDGAADFVAMLDQERPGTPTPLGQVGGGLGQGIGQQRGLGGIDGEKG